jgi:hypothetical protein
MADDDETSISPKTDSAIHVLAEFVSDFGRRYQIEPERAARIVVRWAESFELLQLADPEEIREAFHHFPLAIAWDISSGMEKARALSVIEHDDPRQLARRAYAASLLFDESTPLNTLPELADILYDFIRYLERQMDHLLRTGLPRTPFARSRWLYHQLGRLYDTRMTSSPWPFEELCPPGQVVGRPRAAAYQWIKRVDRLTTPSDDVPPRIGRLGAIAPVPRDSALFPRL